MHRRRLESVFRHAIWFAASGCAGGSTTESHPETTSGPSASTAALATQAPVASAVAPAGSQSASAPPAAVPYSETPQCLDEVRANVVAGLKPSITIDYAAIVHGRGAGSGVVPVVEAGRKCATAKNRSDCELKINGVQPRIRGPNDACDSALCGEFLVATSGDDVLVLDEPKELRAFLATIDTPTEALLIAWLNSYRTGGRHIGTCALVKDGGIKQSKIGYVFDASIERSNCPTTVETMEILVTPTGSLKTLKSKGVEKSSVCAGRRTDVHASSIRRSKPAGYLATMMELEHESIHAFERLASELAAHDAPSSLIRAARVAAQDERRHTRMMSKLAARRAPRSSSTPSEPRSLEELALENEIEGCVRETFGALVATWQAERAPSAGLRGVFSRIAEDETRHASLAHEISSWARRKLSKRARARLDAARARAFVELEDASSDPNAEAAALGLPSPTNARALLSAMRRGIG